MILLKGSCTTQKAFGNPEFQQNIKSSDVDQEYLFGVQCWGRKSLEMGQEKMELSQAWKGGRVWMDRVKRKGQEEG